MINDGSSDSTASIVVKLSESDGRIKLIDLPHGGKGSAVRRGMDEARGEWRFLCDADLSMPIDNLARFFVGVDGHPEYDVAIASREASGSRRFNLSLIHI